MSYLKIKNKSFLIPSINLRFQFFLAFGPRPRSSQVSKASPEPDPSYGSIQQVRRVQKARFYTWASDNFYTIVAIFVLVSTVAAFFFLYSSTNTASLLCLQSQTQRAMDSVSLPHINWNSINPIADKTSPYVNFRSEQWVVVSVSSYPSDALQKMVKIKGWQVLAIGNSRTPRDWSLKGAIFLSLDMQASLGFRVVDHLPYDSYVRKSIGYLFAIQHGAKKIFDVDDRGEVIDNDLGKHFDVELVGEGSRQESILQYSHDNPNRTIVNPNAKKN